MPAARQTRRRSPPSRAGMNASAAVSHAPSRPRAAAQRTTCTATKAASSPTTTPGTLKIGSRWSQAGWRSGALGASPRPLTRRARADNPNGNDCSADRGPCDPRGAGGTDGAPSSSPRAGRLVSFRHGPAAGDQADSRERSEATGIRMQQNDPYRPSTATGTRCARGASRRSGWRSSRRASPASWPRPSCSSGSRPSTYQYPPRRHAAVRAVRLGAARQELPRGWSEAGPPVLERQLAHDLRAGRRRPSSPSRAASTAAHRVEIEAILLPLVHAGNRIGRIIGAMSATSAPHWLGSDPCAAGASCTTS